VLKRLLCVSGGILAVILVVVAAAWLSLAGSLPVLDGRVRSPALGFPVTIERDSRGAVTIEGSRRTDLSYAMGFAHAQDRFFQMDLLRRASAGELSALFGSATLVADRQLRVHGFRERARVAFAAGSPAERSLVEAYTAGVNAGVQSLQVSPFEYLLLHVKPQRWEPEDCFLVGLAMFLQLQEADGHSKQQRGLVRENLPETGARFVYAQSDQWNAAIDGTKLDPPRVPSPEDYDLRTLGALDFNAPVGAVDPPMAAGSNNWALAGARTATRAALVANDMHLTIRVPNTWYHIRLKLDAGDQSVDVTGVSLPGTPLVVAGSNRHVAWGFTNSNGDFEDVVSLVPDPNDPDRYLTADGPYSFIHTKETIEVKGGNPVELDVVGTKWGPVIGKDAGGHALALEWTAHDPAALNMALVDLEGAQSVNDAVAVANRVGIPAQNFVVGDTAGHIAWTIAGKIPLRHQGDSSVPRLSTEPIGFLGWVAPADYPRIVDPASRQIATANAPVVGGAALMTLGDGGYDRGTRAVRILSDLAANGDKQTPADQLAVQLDDAAIFLERWRNVLAAILDEQATTDHPRRAELRLALDGWSGHARVDDAAYRLVRAFRSEVEKGVFFALIAPARAKNPSFRFTPPSSFEGPLWAVVEQQPKHLLPPGSANWREFLLAAADSVVAALSAECPQLTRCTWGQANLSRIRHPLSNALPELGLLTDMPVEPLAGDKDMPRVAGPSFGASERFAVSPDHEAEAYLHMPGGQSGHPLSPYFRTEFDAWARGVAVPFLPGIAEHRLILSP
jgi:penicillin amidase